MYSAHDNEIPKEADFSASGDRIFCITQKGLFSSWEYETMRSLVSIPFDMTTVTMIVFKTQKFILIAFEKEIIVLDVEKMKETEVVKDFGIESQHTISDVKVSLNEEFMAVAIAPSEETNAKIEFFRQLRYVSGFLTSKKLQYSDNVKISDIIYMDFCIFADISANFLFDKENCFL